MALSHVNLTPQFVQAVRDAVDIVAVAEDYTSLSGKGKRAKGLCPLHKEKTPSFSVDPDQNLFYCFGCGRGGDAIKLHMELTGDDFPAAMESLARRFGVPLPKRSAGGRDDRERDLTGVLERASEYFAAQLADHDSPRRYLEERGIEEELASRYGLGYAPPGWDNLLTALGSEVPRSDLEKAGLVARSSRQPDRYYDRFRERLMFPIHTASGRLVGFGGRTLGDDDAKYINTPETASFQKSRLLYGLDRARRAIREHGVAVLLEGYFDVLGTVAAGVEHAVATMGTSLTAEQAGLLGRYADEVVLCYDGDAAGDEAARRALPLLLAEDLAVRRAELPSDSDPDELRLREGDDAVRRLVERSPDMIERELERLVPPTGASLGPRRRAELASAVAELLEPIPDPILRYAHGRRAAERLGIPFELLAPKLGARRATQGTGKDVEEETDVSHERAPGVDLERAALRALLELLDEAFEGSGRRGEALEELELVEPEVFWDRDCRALYAAVRELLEDGRDPSVETLRAGLDPSSPTVDLLARLLLEESPEQESEPPAPSLRRDRDPHERMHAAFEWLRRRWLDKRLRDLSRDIDVAQREGDDSRLDRLVERKLELSRQLHSSTETAVPDAAVRTARPTPSTGAVAATHEDQSSR